MDFLPIRVILASTDRLTSDVLAAALDKPLDITVCNTLVGVESLPLHLGAFDVAVLHARLPRDEVIQAISVVRKSAAGCCAIVVGAPDIPTLVVPYFEAGARGYVSTEEPVERLLDAVRSAHAGAATVNPDLAHALVLRLTELSRAVKRHTYADKGDLLSRRELEVLEHVERGLSNQQIAAELCIQEGTVKNHVHNILSKLQLKDRRQAAVWLQQRRGRSPEGDMPRARRRATWRRGGTRRPVSPPARLD